MTPRQRDARPFRHCPRNGKRDRPGIRHCAAARKALRPDADIRIHSRVRRPATGVLVAMRRASRRRPIPTACSCFRARLPKIPCARACAPSPSTCCCVPFVRHRAGLARRRFSANRRRPRPGRGHRHPHVHLRRRQPVPGTGDRPRRDRAQPGARPAWLLRGRAGIDLGNQGGLGKISTLFLRGTESDQVLVLVDGVRIGSATAGLVSFQDIPVEQIDRIEIVRGPRSSLYGSEAVGGVIQIFTRRDRGAFAPRFRVGIGSNHLREASAGIGGGNERGWYGARISPGSAPTASMPAMDRRRCSPAASSTNRPRRLPQRLAQPARRPRPRRHGEARSARAARRGVQRIRRQPYGGNEADNVQQALSAKLAWRLRNASR